MPVLFSEEFNVDAKLIEATGVFDVIMDIDTQVFIDPALLELCTEVEFVGAKEKAEKHFSNIITLMKHCKNNHDMYWKKADELLTFKEIRGTCFGYSEKGTSGNAIGPKLRKNILATIKELINEGEEDPTLFELLGVFQEKIGCDRISDLLTFLLFGNIIKYSERVAKECNLPTIKRKYNGKVYDLCFNPYNNLPLLLLPKVILSPLPVADDFDDIDWICCENQRVRDAINLYFDFGDRKKLSKKEIFSLMKNSKDFRETLLDSYKTLKKNPYDFTEDKAGEYIWCPVSKEYASKYPIEANFISLETFDDVKSVVLKICEQFKLLIENNGLSALLYDSNGNPKHESAAQLLFFGVSDAYCNANNLDLTRESNAGRGPVDFKLSRGLDKFIVEVKLTSNSQLKHGAETQVPIYMNQEKTKRALYLIIDNGHQKALDNFIEFYNNLDTTTKNKISYLVIDGTKKKSASKA